MKNAKGITLVSLIVTIIVLVILAGVSINLVLGENGIITKTKEAKQKTEQATLNEEIALNELYMQMESESIELGDTSYDAIANNIDIFSTDEVKTKEVWIDGKPIYKKTIVAEVTRSNSNFSILHNINNIGNFRAVDYSHTFLIRKTTSEYVPLPQIVTVSSQLQDYQASVTFINNQDIWVQSGTQNLGTWTITIMYTKTTD